MAATVTDSDNGVRVTVSPAQSSFFAGEQFVVTVTFTNTRAVNSSAAMKRTPSQSHKRAAHSVSTVMLARPPTSPRTPQTAFTVMPNSGQERKKDGGSRTNRRGLIGLNLNRDNSQNPLNGGGSIRRKLLTKSMSVSITADELDLSGVIQAIKNPNARMRDASLPLNPSHPHARKISVLDGQSQVQLQLQDISTSPSSVASPFPGSASASTSAFSLALDTISEGGPTPGPATANDAGTHSYPPRQSTQKMAYSGLGQGPPPLADLNHPPKTALASTFSQPNTELILYSYAQLVGSLTLGDSSSSDTRGQQEGALNSVRVALLRKQRQAIGGGSMDIKSSLDMSSSSSRTSIAGFANPRMRRSHSRASSLSSSIFSLLSPSSSNGSPALPWTPARKSSSSSIISSFLSPSASSPAALSANTTGQVGLGLGIDRAEEELVDPSTLLPTFDVQPAMLAVDLALAPGESRTFTYTLPLPSNLPPTYKGRMLKFTYHLVVGVCRAAPTPILGTGYASYGTPGGGKGASTSRVMRIPIRVYNNVVESGIQRPYDLLWPASQSKQKDQPGKVAESTQKNGVISQYSLTSTATQTPQIQSLDAQAKLEALASLQRHAIRLLASLPAQTPALPHDSDSTTLSSPPPVAITERQGQGELTGCREAVEILTRNMRKSSYDVNKDGVKVAVLTFTKSAYRLGETVVGVVELNERGSRAKVLKLTAILEAQETLPGPLASSGMSSSVQGRKLKKVHAEHHTSLIPSTLRTTFTLDIPSDATPAFRCSCDGNSPSGGGNAIGGLEWKVRLCLLVSVASEHAREGFDGLRVKHLIRDGPRGEWGTAWRPTRGISPLQKIDRRKAAAAAAATTTTKSSSQTSISQNPRGWAAYFISSMLTPGEREYHDGDEEPYSDSEPESGSESESGRNRNQRQRQNQYTHGHSRGYDDGFVVDSNGEIDIGGGERGWEELRVETVECEVPVKVWPGNTAFKPLEVEFEL